MATFLLTSDRACGCQKSYTRAFSMQPRTHMPCWPRVTGYAHDTGGNGNDTRLRFAGIVSLANGKLVKQAGPWWFTGGTGKLAGIRGQGSYACVLNSEGGADCDLTGEYSMALKDKVGAAPPNKN